MDDDNQMTKLKRYTLLQGSELNVIECFLETKVPIIGNINSEYFVSSDVTPHFYGECSGKYKERLNFVTSLLFNLFPEKFSVKKIKKRFHQP